MKPREKNGLDPHAERELAAIDDALAGRPVEPGLEDLGELASLLRSERLDPDEAWAAELDRRAAGRFRPEGGGGWRAAWERVRALPPRRIAAPIGALATLAVVAAVSVSSMTKDGGDNAATGGDVPPPVSVQSGGDAAGAAETDAAASTTEVAPMTVEPEVSDDGFSTTADPGDDFRAYRRTDQSKLSPGTSERQVDRDVSMTLAAQPDEVRDVSDEVISITRSAEGIVVSSQVTEQGRQSVASLELSIPSDELDGAIDRLSDLAHVDSLNEATQDITHPFVTAQDRLRDAIAERKSLLQALENATTEAEADALRAQIADASDRIARARARFENIARQARWSTVSVQVVADSDAAAADEDDGRSLGDWADDALDVLRDVAGVLLVAAAIIVPLGILAAIAWLLIARVLRRRRERALDG